MLQPTEEDIEPAVCVFARVYCTCVNVRVIRVAIYWCVFAYECIFAKRRQKEREV